MNKLARKLVLSVLSVVLTVVALGTTTFAWFTLTNTSVVQPFNANVVADTGIEVAVGMPLISDPVLLNWKSVITTQDMTNYLNAKYPAGFAFNHVTSANGRTFTDLEGEGVTSGYIEIPLHFRSNNSTIINWTNVVVESPTASWRTGVTFIDSIGEERVAGGTFEVNAADAVRISITGNHQVSDGDGGFIPTNVTVAYENPASEPNRNTILGAKVNADFRGNEVPEGSGEFVGVNGSTNYYYKVNNMLPNGAGSVNTVGTIQALTSGTKILDMVENPSVMPEAKYYGVVTIRIWIEGWDGEAYNSILGRVITTSFRFAA